MKLFTISATFDKKQWTGFTAYVELYHKPKSTICRIVSFLNDLSIWNRTNEESIKIERIRSTLPFKINSKTFLNSLAVLGNLAEEYIGWMVWKDSTNLKRPCVLKALAKKSLSDEYLKIQKEVLQDNNNDVISIWDDYYKMQTLFNDYYYKISNSNDNYTEEFKDLVHYFRKSTATLSQFLMVEIRNREKLLLESWQSQIVFFNGMNTEETDVRKITNLLIRMNYSNEYEAYEEIISFLRSEKIYSVSILIKNSLVIYCINYLTGLIKKGEIDKAQDLLDLYEFSFEKGIITLNDSMPIKSFINIIGVASKLNKYDWVRKIVDNWAHKVDMNNSKAVKKFGHATIDFHQKKYENVVKTLSQIKTTSFQHKLSLRWLLLRAQFELNTDYVDVLKVQIDNFRRFIISNESRIKRTSYEGFKASIKILHMLLNRRDIKEIESYYTSSKFVFERKWVLEKIKNPVL